MFIPLILLAAVLAGAVHGQPVGSAKADYRAFGAAVHNRHTWIISFLYIGTFGSFIGYSGAFPTLLKNQFPEVTLSIAFLGALVGSLARPLGGMLADRWGGARITIAAFADDGRRRRSARSPLCRSASFAAVPRARSSCCSSRPASATGRPTG